MLKSGVLSQIQVTADHKVYFGDTTPKLIISRKNQLCYRNFDFFMQMRSWSGHDVCNQFSMYNGIIKRVGQNFIKPLYEMHKDLKGNKLITDYFVENGTFVNIDAIILEYTSIQVSGTDFSIRRVSILLCAMWPRSPNTRGIWGGGK